MTLALWVSLLLRALQEEVFFRQSWPILFLKLKILTVWLVGCWLTQAMQCWKRNWVYSSIILWSRLNLVQSITAVCRHSSYNLVNVVEFCVFLNTHCIVCNSSAWERGSELCWHGGHSGPNALWEKAPQSVKFGGTMVDRQIAVTCDNVVWWWWWGC